ncbi:Major facilitator superfamily domain-containing protein 3 [Taenia crassiceps]|uniref:Major facilitator superfamily domain-containing protein 3 n=1 Tax=Taenia crassiceps TaxID=6207 RepID=A0ABR4QRS0_9CEST
MVLNLPSSHLITLFFFYSLQGVPYGLQSRFLPLVLRSNGSSLTSLGFYKLLFLPWVFKSAYAPFVDSHGTRRRWLQFCTAGLLLCCAFLSTFPDAQLVSSTRLLPFCLFILNFCAATLDIAVDSLAIDMLKHSELSRGNTAQVVGYKLGAVVGGGLLSSFFSLTVVFAALCGVYAVGLGIATCYKKFDELEGVQIVTDDKDCKRGNRQNYSEVLRMALFDSPSTPGLVVLLLSYKLGELGAMNMLPLMLLDNGMSVTVVGFWTGVVGQVFSIAGSSSASAIVRCFGSTADSLQGLFVCRMVIISLVTAFAFSINLVSPWFGVALMNATLVVSGAITTNVFTLMMECTRSEVTEGARATHYTILSTAEVLGKLLFSALGAAALTDILGYSFAYLLFLALTILPPSLLAFGRRQWPFLSSKKLSFGDSRTDKIL